jgi:hypothetical protein
MYFVVEVTGKKSILAESDANAKVITNVAKMLAMLKLQVKNARKYAGKEERELNKVTKDTNDTIGTDTEVKQIITNENAGKDSHKLLASMASNYEAFELLFKTSPHTLQTSSEAIENMINLLHQMNLTLKLKDADSVFLLDELDKKESLLALLTEGLREVDI